MRLTGGHLVARDVARSRTKPRLSRPRSCLACPSGAHQVDVSARRTHRIEHNSAPGTHGPLPLAARLKPQGARPKPSPFERALSSTRLFIAAPRDKKS